MDKKLACTHCSAETYEFRDLVAGMPHVDCPQGAGTWFEPYVLTKINNELAKAGIRPHKYPTMADAVAELRGQYNKYRALFHEAVRDRDRLLDEKADQQSVHGTGCLGLHDLMSTIGVEICTVCGKSTRPQEVSNLTQRGPDDSPLKQILEYAKQYGDALHIYIWYPRTDNPIKAIQVGLMDVRAADDIRIEYDFERDGWVISQAQVFEWDVDERVDPEWKEVAFIKAWASERNNE